MSGGVFSDIDRKMRAYQRRMDTTRRMVRELGGHAVRADSTGGWSCSYRSTKAGRMTRRLVARSPASLLKLLMGAEDRPGRRALVK